MTTTQIVDDDNNILVFLDRKRVVAPISYNIEEGWVEVIDHSKLTLQLPNRDEEIEVNLSTPEPLETFPTRRLYGKIEIRQLRKDI